MTATTPTNDGQTQTFGFLLLLELALAMLFLTVGLYKSHFGYASSTEDDEHRASIPRQAGAPPANLKPVRSLETPWQVPGSNGVSEQLSRAIFDLTNRERERKNLAPFQWEPGLAVAAVYHGEDMDRRGFFDHINPDDVGPAYRVAKLHRRFIGSTGENIALIRRLDGPIAAWAEEFVTGWMNSTGHRENILRPSFTHLGVGCFRKTEQDGTVTIYATQVFGGLCGYTKNDVPLGVTPGQTLQLAADAENPEFTGVAAAAMLNLADNQTVTPSAGLTLKAPSRPGVYQLLFHFPLKNNPNVYTIARGPLFTVK